MTDICGTVHPHKIYQKVTPYSNTYTIPYYKRQLTLVAKDFVALGTLELRLMVGVLVQPMSLHQVLACEHAMAHVALGGETSTLPVVTLEVGLERDLAWAATATQAAAGNGRKSK